MSPAGTAATILAAGIGLGAIAAFWFKVASGPDEEKPDECAGTRYPTRCRAARARRERHAVAHRWT